MATESGAPPAVTPSYTRRSRGLRTSWWIRAAVVAIAVLAVSAFALRGTATTWGGRLFGGVDAGISEYMVEPVDLSITIVEDGEIKPKRSIELKNEVEGQSTILFIVEESAHVSEGDLLVELASESLVDRIETEQIELDKITAELEAAEQELEIQRNQNDSDISKAEIELQLAEKELNKYLNGDYQKDLRNVDIQIEETQLKLARKRIEYNNNLDLFERDFVTEAKLEQINLEKTTLEMQLEQHKLAKRILEDYEKPMKELQLTSEIDQAREALERTRKQANSREKQAIAKVEQYRSLLTVRQSRVDRLREQLNKCKIYAPTDGVVQYPQDGHRWSSDDTLAIGSKVNEGQTLVVLPDTSQLLVSLRVHEADRHRLRPGMRCLVRVAAVPGDTFSGRITKIADFADSTNRWLNPELKEHATEVLLDPTDAPLSPGDSAEVEILVDNLENVLAVPVQCVYARGKRHFLFAHRDGGWSPVSVKLGPANVNLIQVTDGVAAGDRVRMSADELLLAELPSVDAEPVGPEAFLEPPNAADRSADRPRETDRDRPRTGTGQRDASKRRSPSAAGG